MVWGVWRKGKEMEVVLVWVEAAQQRSLFRGKVGVIESLLDEWLQAVFPERVCGSGLEDAWDS